MFAPGGEWLDHNRNSLNLSPSPPIQESLLYLGVIEDHLVDSSQQVRVAEE